jgi:RraA family protein
VESSVLATADVSDAAGGGVALDPRIRAVWSGARLQGRAFTVRTPAGQHPAVQQALELAAPGDVIVVDGGGSVERALWGDKMALRAQERGIAGVVIFGAVRDAAQVEQLGFPLFALTSVPTAPLGELDGETGIPIVCAGMPVAPGDLVVGDVDGVVVVPRAAVDEVLARVRELQSG